jgi:hypothetical protein
MEGLDRIAPQQDWFETLHHQSKGQEPDWNGGKQRQDLIQEGEVHEYLVQGATYSESRRKTNV